MNWYSSVKILVFLFHIHTTRLFEEILPDFVIYPGASAMTGGEVDKYNHGGLYLNFVNIILIIYIIYNTCMHSLKRYANCKIFINFAIY